MKRRKASVVAKKPEEKINKNSEVIQDQKGNQIDNSENVTCNITKNNRNSARNVNKVEAVKLPEKKKLDFKYIREQLMALSSDSREKSTKKSKETENVDFLKEELKQLEDPPLSKLEKDLTASRLKFDFFNKPCEQLAQDLLGKILVRRLENGKILKGRIVETESYIGTIDKASQTYEYRVSDRSLPLYMIPGTISVYMTYGMYHCINISSQGDGCAVLIRALEPMEGLEEMTENRNPKKKSSAKQARKEFKDHELCNGPSKFCMAFSLNRNHSKYSLCSWKSLWIEEDNLNQEEIQIVKCKRIGIESCPSAEWVKKPLRYYIYDNKSVSKREKSAEANFLKTDLQSS